MRSLIPAKRNEAHVHERRSRECRNDLIRALTHRGNGSTRVLTAIFGFLALTNVAWGADLSPPFAPVPYSWTGLYIGGNVGYAAATDTETVSGGGGSGSTSIPGFVGGGQIGFNYQIGAIIAGFEADFDGSTTTKSTAAGIVSSTEQIPWIGTLRGRLGVAFNRFLVYGTAGGAATELVSVVNAGAIGSANTAVTHGGWTAGGGIEFAVSDSLGARVEYLYVDTGTVNAAIIGPPVTTVTNRLQENLIRVGLDYRLPVAW